MATTKVIVCSLLIISRWLAKHIFQRLKVRKDEAYVYYDLNHLIELGPRFEICSNGTDCFLR